MSRGTRGFTLLEVVIAMTIMAFLSLFTVQSIQRALSAKTKIEKQLDKTSTIRDALRIMERDINMAFNYRDVSIKLYNLTQEARKKQDEEKRKKGKGGNTGIGTTSPALGGNPAPNANPNPNTNQDPNDTTDPNKYALKTEKIYTQFIGEKAKLDFTTLSNMRMTEDSPISMQAEVGYYLKNCRRRSNQEQASQCLWRRVSNYIHEDITKEGEETVLLENVIGFGLRYLGPGNDDQWTDTWFSNERGDDKTKGKFPYAVEITIEVHDKDPAAKDKPLRMTAVAAIRNPGTGIPEEPKKEGAVADPNAPLTN